MPGTTPATYYSSSDPDDTLSIQAALTAAGPGGWTQLEDRPYSVSATLTMQPNAKLFGRGGDSTPVQRTGNYGDTLFCDNAGSAEVAGIFFTHGTPYAAGNTSLDVKATTGAHIRFRHAQKFKIEENICWRLPYGIYLESCTVGDIASNWAHGVNDPLYPACQEGVADLVLDNASTGHTQIIKARGNYFTGVPSAARNFTYFPADHPSGVVKNHVVNVGRQYGILNFSCEDLDVTKNYFGGQSSVSFYNSLKSGGVNLDHRYRGNLFDGATDASIYFSTQDNNQWLEGVDVSGNIFNGEGNSKNAIIAYNPVGSGAVLRNFGMGGNNQFFAHVGTPIMLYHAKGGVIGPNTISRYNCLGVSATDLSYISGIQIEAPARDILIQGNPIGGYGDWNANCKRGIAIAAGLTNVVQQNNLNIGVTTWP